ncbi:hypothetical protein PIROE2DRAFT_20713 [Piromyces sp. E2]|nr:hypothetical protein PIROE2DRAFT_20713 [Piromyces sp. E2]|eukprot:OUM63077.1 hypothetical protein PIROE2DRAFT_20713 [Piromyces sp. E2]
MLRYASHHNYEKKAVRKSHDKTKSNKRKSKKDITANSITEIENITSKPAKPSKHTKKYENIGDDDSSFYNKEEYHYIPKTWKDSWKKPLNQNIDVDEYDASHNKIRTSKISKRQNSRKNTFIVDMLTESS